MHLKKKKKKFPVRMRIGNRRIKRSFETAEEARHFRLSMLQRKFGGVSVHEPLAIGLAIKLYHQTISQESKSKGACVNDLRYLRVAYYYFISIEGLELIHEVNLKHLERFVIWLKKPHTFSMEDEVGTAIDYTIQGYGPSTINRWFSTYRHFFKKMKAWKHHHENPCEDLPILHEDPVIKRRWPVDAVDLVRTECPPWFLDCFEFLYQTGHRPSSIERLTWEMIDQIQGLYYTDSFKGGRKTLHPHAIRPEIQAIFLRQRTKYPPFSKEDPVFRNSEGRKLTADLITKTGMRAIRQANLKAQGALDGLELYGLRDLITVDLLEAGVDSEKVRRVLGHNDDRSLKKYASVLDAKRVGQDVDRVRSKAKMGHSVH